MGEASAGTQTWLEMADIRRRSLSKAVWIPLRASRTLSEVGQYGHEGYLTEFFGAGSLAIPVGQKIEPNDLGWSELGLRVNHCGRLWDGKYTPAHQLDMGPFLGEFLVMSQQLNQAENLEWHLNLDCVVTLGLKREDDSWVRPDESYIEVARLIRDSDGSPELLEIRASHLRDYLCAREMALFVSSYRKRVAVVETHDLAWESTTQNVKSETDAWEGRVLEIHEGGEAFGGRMAVFHAGRTDVDPEEDVPTFDFPTGDEVATDSWSQAYTGRKLYRLSGELWRTERIEPASTSPIVRGDAESPTVFFITDAEGKREHGGTLVA